MLENYLKVNLKKALAATLWTKTEEEAAAAISKENDSHISYSLESQKVIQNKFSVNFLESDLTTVKIF